MCVTLQCSGYTLAQDNGLLLEGKELSSILFLYSLFISYAKGIEIENLT